MHFIQNPVSKRCRILPFTLKQDGVNQSDYTVSFENFKLSSVQNAQNEA